MENLDELLPFKTSEIAEENGEEMKLRIAEETDPHLGGRGFSPKEAQQMVLDFHSQERGSKSILETGLTAISFDRSEILRILGQDGCEGIRCYLAMSSYQFDKEKQTCQKVEEPRPTLLIVAIDKYGKDLLKRYGQKYYIACSECGTDCNCPPPPPGGEFKLGECDPRLRLLNTRFK